MKEAFIHLPIVYGDTGEPLDRKAVGFVATQIMDQFGGFTLNGSVRGAWRDTQGEVHNEVMERCIVTADWNDPNNVAALRGIAHLVITMTKQNAVYVAFPQGVELISGPSESEAVADVSQGEAKVA